MKGAFNKGRVITSLYRKPFASNTILNAENCDLKHMIKAIPLVEYVRAKRQCTDEFKEDCTGNNNRLKKRGYRKWMMERAARKNTKHMMQIIQTNANYLED